MIQDEYTRECGESDVFIQVTGDDLLILGELEF